jgi:hypothetical protein
LVRNSHEVGADHARAPDLLRFPDRLALLFVAALHRADIARLLQGQRDDRVGRSAVVRDGSSVRGWPMQHAILASLLWSIALSAIFAPLASTLCRRRTTD